MIEIKVSILGSSSAGNTIVLHNDTEALVLDCGEPYKDVMRLLDYNVSKIVGAVCTHSHSDHSKYVKEYEKAGIPVIKPYEYDRKAFCFNDNTKFTIRWFDCKHNVPCYGFYITHPEIGSMIYAVDTCFIKYRFNKLNHIFVECNWDKEFVDTEQAKYQHELQDHMNLDVCLDFIKANNSEALQSILLCHPSKSALDELKALEMANNVSQAQARMATKGLEFEISNPNVCPF